MTPSSAVHPGLPIEISHLTKTFGTVTAVDDLSFHVTPGRVTGFLGPNGAGKTTTLRILLGLATPTSGSATIGSTTYSQISQPMSVVGAALEASSFHPGRTAIDHLRVLTPQLGIADTRASEVLSMVGLADVANRRVGGFSMGMRQRLGLATTLLGDPSVLILDEPANGLDPEGITWLRNFLRFLAGEGRTVLVSSHMLTEMQQTVDDIVIINHGRLVQASSLAELAELAASHVRVAGPDSEAIARVLREHHWQVTLPEAGAEYLTVTDESMEDSHETTKKAAAKIGATLFAENLEIHELTAKETPLESIFMSLIAQSNNEVSE